MESESNESCLRNTHWLKRWTDLDFLKSNDLDSSHRLCHQNQNRCYSSHKNSKNYGTQSESGTIKSNDQQRKKSFLSVLGSILEV